MASVVLVPCYGQPAMTKPTAPAVKAQAKPIVSAEKRFAQKAYEAAVEEAVAVIESNAHILRGREGRMLSGSARCWKDLKIETELTPLLIANSPERRQACEDLDTKSEVEEERLRTQGAKLLLEANAMVDLLKTRLDYADTCAKVYRTTGNKKVSDVTVIETEQIKECRSLNQYPPER